LLLSFLFKRGKTTTSGPPNTFTTFIPTSLKEIQITLLDQRSQQLTLTVKMKNMVTTETYNDQPVTFFKT